MTPVNWLSRLFFPRKSEFTEHAILPIEEQIKAWRIANKKMKWDIGGKEFNGIDAPPSLTGRHLEQGFVGIALFYGSVTTAQDMQILFFPERWTGIMPVSS